MNFEGETSRKANFNQTLRRFLVKLQERERNFSAFEAKPLRNLN